MAMSTAVNMLMRQQQQQQQQQELSAASSMFKQFCYPLKKIFYKEHPRVEERSWDDIDKFLNLHQIKFSGFDVPKPIFAMDEINFPDFIINELRMQGVTRPSAIQSMTWPALYSGRDIMCIGMPASSRVLSYMCPALVFVRAQERELRRNKRGPLVLVVTQTKEVAKEIATHAQMLIQQSQCTYCCVLDDENLNTQTAQLVERDYDIIIGNYHRLCELLDLNVLYLKDVAFLVMDDFYRNRSARLSDEIKRVVNETRNDRQTAIYSRIVPSGLQKSNGDEFQNDSIFVCVNNDDIHVVHNKDMPQQIHVCTMAEKKKKLQDLITEIQEREGNKFKILVYANGFKKIRITEKIIKELGVDTFAYERTTVGKRRRAMKEKVYYNFNATPNSILIASDVVSSKVELPDLKYIINADFPLNLSLYLNRMRMSNIKSYISIFIAEDARHADRLIHVLNECRQEVPPILYKISEAYTNSGKDVDRMPSLQEIAEGLTRPVEKPIPKPLPPTVPLEDGSVGSKRMADDRLKSATEPSTSDAATASTAPPQLPSPANSSSSNSSSSRSSPPGAASTASSSSKSSNYQQQQSKRFRPSYPQQQQPRPPPQQYYSPHQNRFQPPSPAAIAAAAATGVSPYAAGYGAARSPLVAYYPPAQAAGMLPPHVRNLIASQQQQAYAQALQAQALQQQYYRGPATFTPPQPQVKMEPVEPTPTLPYFTNPIPFKVEPTEQQQQQQQPQQQQQTASAAAHDILNKLMRNESLMSQLQKVRQSIDKNNGGGGGSS